MDMSAPLQTTSILNSPWHKHYQGAKEHFLASQDDDFLGGGGVGGGIIPVTRELNRYAEVQIWYQPVRT